MTRPGMEIEEVRPDRYDVVTFGPNSASQVYARH